MATDLTQDAVLYFLQSNGGSVKNADLLQHFNDFIRIHVDRERNRERFKKFVNSVATVTQIDGVSYVVLRKKYRGNVPGVGTGDPASPAWITTRDNLDSSPVNVNRNPTVGADQHRQKPQQREEAVPTPSGEPGRKTVLPSAGILQKNDKVETGFNLKQKQEPVVSIAPELISRSGPAQMVGQSREKKQQMIPSLSQLPDPVQSPRVGQQRLGSGPLPGPSQEVPVPEPQRRREMSLRPAEDVSPQLALHRFRHRKSYKSAVSEDDDDDEEHEEVPIGQCSAGGVWTLNPSESLSESGRAFSASSPSITDSFTASFISSSSSSAEKKLPQIYIQSEEGEMKAPSDGKPQEQSVGMEAGSAPEELMSIRRSQPPEAAHRLLPTHQVPKPAADLNTPPVQRHAQPPGAPMMLSSSHSSILTSSSHDAGFSSREKPSSSSSRVSGWSSNAVGLQTRAGEPVGVAKIQELVQQPQRLNTESVMYCADIKTSIPRHHSMDNVYDIQHPTVHPSARHPSSDQLSDDQQFPTKGTRWHVSTGDLCDDHKDGSISSPHIQQRPMVARRVSSRLRSRMCQSLGADLDQLLQEEANGGVGGNEAARLDRLHLISSSLSLHYNMSSSSLSSCATPPRCPSPGPTVPDEGKGSGGRRSNPPTGHHVGQSPLPLEPREHAWMVKAAAGAWTDIYSLFREDPSLLNRQDFISGFTVLHWIAKHGDHRVLNTLWYGAEKGGLAFNVNTKSASGQTPLHIAAIHGNKNVIRLLVTKFDADVRLRDMAGRRPWQYLSQPSHEILEMLRAPPKAAVTGEGRVGTVDSSWQPQQQRRRHFSTASPGKRPLIVADLTKVKRSTSFAALLKHKSLQRFYGLQSDSSV
ncbi:ankyrin repeat domain-containing protein SOWAHB-like [Melanotaenia boesemani]|uniref:ankyrin repeat domain-containing protein SOWAHB-like n=1 Tax=Melanotaenia boesemani TaxID=1250792 RepID=UPI001C04AD39|nr:ankyrin repeat domain-containing protein SOWAHB-like [Melanotaenia boesemani]